MGQITPDLTNVVTRYVQGLVQAGITPERVLLYGSHARGSAGPHSDIDLLIVSQGFDLLPPPERPKVLARANRALRAPIQALWATPETLAQAHPASFLALVLSEAVDVTPRLA